ncbi:hypothetical protein C3495_11800 [Clostridiaceae bacterium 14S0207]|nr:hypothetical protein C3495_11800 [Clostridiaceae bacterium 14S0207]
MNKKNTKMLSGALAATTVLTSAAPVFAKGTDWNKVYENAFKAMQKAEKDKTQESINAARKAIAELAKNKELISLVGTLSEHVDGVQQGLFNDFYALMYVDGKEKPRMSQKEINEARECVNSFATCDVNKQYTQSWSSAVDKFQQNNVNEMVAAVKKAQETKDVKDVEAAKALVAELETSTNKDVLNATAAEKAKVEAVEKEIQKENAKLKVEKVQFANLKKATISFNKELDKATVEKVGNVRVFKDNAEVAGLTVKLAEDKKTAYVVNTANKFDQLQTYRFVISNIATVEGEKVEKTELTAKSSDNSFPTVVDVKATSPKTLVVKFSEPVKGLPNAAGVTEKIQIDGINAYLAVAVDTTKMVDENTAIITLGNPLTVGEHTVKISDLKDEIDLPLEANSTKVTLVEDKVVPAVTNVVADRNTVKVTFNKVVDKATVIAGNFKVNGEEPEADIKTEDGQTYVLTLKAGHKLGLASLVEAKLTYNNIADNYGNKVEKEQTVEFTAQDDKVAPIMAGTKVNDDNSVEVSFTEKVENATTTANYELLDKDGKVVAGGITNIADITKAENKGTVVKVTVKDADKISGKFSIKAVKNNTIVDESVRENKLAETILAFNLNDKVAPEVKGDVIYVQETAGKDFNKDNDVKDSKFTVYFTKAMNPTTLLNKANYIFNNKSLMDLKDATLTVGKDNKSVTVIINRNDDATQEVMAGAKLRVLRLEDSVGNRIKDENKEINFTAFVENTGFTDMIEKAELVSLNQVKVYAKDGQVLTKIDPNKVSFTANNVAIEGLQVMNVVISADGQNAILTLNKNVSGDVKDGGNAIKLKAAAKAITNNAEMSNDASVADMAIADMVKASLVKKAEEAVKVEDNKVILTFDEALTVPEVNVLPAVAQSLVVRDSKGNRLSYVNGDYSVAVAGKTITVTMNKIGFNDKVSVALENNTTIFDANKLAINDFKVVTDKEVVKKATGVVAVFAISQQGVTKVDKVASTVTVGGASDKITVKDPDGKNEVKVTIKKEGTELKVASTKENEIEITIATDESNKNTAALIQTGLRKLAGYNNWEVQAVGNWDAQSKDTDITTAEAVTTGGVVAVAEAKETYTITVNNGATEDGTIVVKVGDKTWEVEVKKGNTAEQVATAINTKIGTDKLAGFGEAVAGNVVTLTKTAAGAVDDVVGSVQDK